MVWIKGFVIVLAALVASVLVLSWFGAARWASNTRALTDRLAAARMALEPTRVDLGRELEGLPAPVQRYFRAALKDGQPMVAAVAIEHRGEFNLAAEGGDRWVPFSSQQRVVVRRPGFVWDARMPIFPGLAVHVVDAYVAGRGVLKPALMGLIPLADIDGTSPEPGGVAHGELLRFAAEAPWYPTALLPSQGVRWRALDERSAEASLGDGAVRVTMRFEFDATSGLITGIRADRGRTLGGRIEMTPWDGRWSAHAEREGGVVPLRGDVAWLTPAGRRPYWRGEVVGLQFEFEERAPR